MKQPLRLSVDLTNNEIHSINENSRKITISKEEIKTVNKYTVIDSLILTIIDGDISKYNKIKRKMTKGKAEDYRLFLGIYEHFDGLPKQIYKYLNKYHFCGKAKIEAMESRYGTLKIIE